jgi:hypothetical protein
MHEATRHAQTLLPVEVHRRLHDLAYESGLSIGALLREGAVLILLHHHRGDGLAEPTPPMAPKDTP